MPLIDDQALAQALGKLLLMPYAEGIKATLGQMTGVDLDFSVGHPEASKWLARHSLTMAKGINDTTKKALRTALAEGVKLGESRDQLADRVRGTVSDMTERRARLIAQTESVSAYAQGSLATMRQAVKEGVPLKKRWLDQQSGACETCRALHGTEIAVDAEFKDPIGKLAPVQGPPIHPGDRCAVVSVYQVPEGPPEGEVPHPRWEITPETGGGVIVDKASAALWKEVPGPYRALAQAGGLKDVKAVNATGMAEFMGLPRAKAQGIVGGYNHETGELRLLLRDREAMRRTLHHELAHTMDKRVGTYPNDKLSISEGKEWQEAGNWQKRSGTRSDYRRKDTMTDSPVTNYGGTAPWEDFAETFRVYTTGDKFDRRGMMQTSRKRFEFMKKFTEGMGQSYPI